MLRGYVDIHAHVLPGIDDGPPDLDSAIAMVRAAADVGITRLAATPHLRSDFPDVHIEELAARGQMMRDAIDAAGIPVELIVGAEVSLVWALEASDEQLKQATYDQRGTDLLLETPLGTVSGLDRLLYELRLRGFRLTLAHPERNPEFQEDPGLLEELVQQSVFLQINAGSVADLGRRTGARRLAERLCRDGLAHVLASDGHRADGPRSITKIARGADALTELVGADRAAWMLGAVPQALTTDEPVPDPPPITRRRSKGWLFKRQ